MFVWLESLAVIERVLLYIAVPATLILMIQLVLLLVGLGGGDGGDGADADASLDLDGDGIPDGLDLDGDGIPDDLEGDGVPDGDAGGTGFFAGLNVLTLRGIVTFLTLFGWSGLMFCQIGVHPFLALFLGVQVGVIGMVGVALLLRSALRLQYDGTLDIRNTLGLTGCVYLTVPAAGGGTGKVNVTVQEQLREFEAVTGAARAIPTGKKVRVVGVTGESTLVVIPLQETEA